MDNAKNTFVLDPRLQGDCIPLLDFELSSVLLMNNANYPWIITVPRVAGVTEIIELSEPQQQELWQESRFICQLLQQQYAPDKLNVAAIGNLVSQLHIHHVARYSSDGCWPAPVWGNAQTKPYNDEQKTEQVALLKAELGRY